MKKIIYLTAIFMCLSFVSCKKNEDKPKELYSVPAGTNQQAQADPIKESYNIIFTTDKEDTVYEEMDKIKENLEKGESITQAAKDEATGSYQNIYSSMYAQQNIENLSKIKLNIVSSPESPEILNSDKVFFEDKFNTLMTDFLNGNFPKYNLHEFLSFLEPFYNNDKTFVEKKIDAGYDKYNSGTTTYEALSDWYAILQDSAFASDYITNKKVQLDHLYNSKDSYNKGNAALENYDYITAIDFFTKIEDFDLRYSEKETLITKCKEGYEKYISETVNKYLVENEYDKAEKLIKEAMDKFNDRELDTSALNTIWTDLKAKQNEYDIKKSEENKFKSFPEFSTVPDFDYYLNVKASNTKYSGNVTEYIYTRDSLAQTKSSLANSGYLRGVIGYYEDVLTVNADFVKHDTNSLGYDIYVKDNIALYLYEDEEDNLHICIKRN